MSIFREAIVDQDGAVDVSYLALFWVMVSVLGAITFICAMSAWAFLRCHANCVFDAQGIGIAVAAICGGFATAIGGLAAYMAATKHERVKGDSNGVS